MIKINRDVVKALYGLSGIGHFSDDYGAVIGDAEFVICWKNDTPDEPYLAHISEFEINGFCVKMKDGNMFDIEKECNRILMLSSKGL